MTDFLISYKPITGIIAGGFPGGSEGKESAYNAGDLGLILGLGRSPGEDPREPLEEGMATHSSILAWRIPMEKKCKKAKWLSGEPLQIAVKRREAKSKGDKERYKHLNAEFQRIARRDKIGRAHV